MWRLSKTEYQRKLIKIKRDNIQKAYWQSLKKEKQKYSNKQPIETSKLIAIYLFILLNAVIVYSMVVMWSLEDLSYLGVLISDIAAQVLIYAIYCLKAYYGKKQEEQMKYRREKLSGSLGDILESASESEGETHPTVDNFGTFNTNDAEFIG